MGDLGGEIRKGGGKTFDPLKRVEFVSGIDSNNSEILGSYALEFMLMSLLAKTSLNCVLLTFTAAVLVKSLLGLVSSLMVARAPSCQFS